MTERSDIGFQLNDVENIKELERCDWFRHFIDKNKSLNSNIYYYNWPSESLQKLLRKARTNTPQLLNVKSLFQLRGFDRINIWGEAVDSADHQVGILLRKINSLKGEVYIIGHSLGGRIAVKLMEHQNKFMTEKVYISALAPAISENEISFKHNYHNVKCEIFYSKYDKILKYAYRAGQFKKTYPLGFAGPSPNNYEQLKWINVSSTFYCKKVGHLDYEEHLLRILAVHSDLWHEFMSDVYTGKLRIFYN